MLKYKEVKIEHYEHFERQTLRSRCEIYGANGRLNLSVPLRKRGERTITKDIRIAYDNDWRTLHWRSMQSAYRRSPYFEFYEDDFVGFYEGEKFEFLVDLNEALLNKINELSGIDVPISKTTSYEKDPENTIDLRNEAQHPSIINHQSFDKLRTGSSTIYYQVFGTKFGFLPNLSIIDLLFNEGGKRGLEYLKAPDSFL